MGAKPLMIPQLAFLLIWSGWKCLSDGTWPTGVLAEWQLPRFCWRWTLHAIHGASTAWDITCLLSLPINIPCLMLATTSPLFGSRDGNWTMLAAGDLIRLGGWKPGVETAKLRLEERSGAGHRRLEGWYHFSSAFVRLCGFQHIGLGVHLG